MGPGRLCSGEFETRGIFAGGGAFGTGGTFLESRTDKPSFAAAKGFLGVGGGAGAGTFQCVVRLSCLNESPVCEEPICGQ